jgi:hypothetical protein
LQRDEGVSALFPDSGIDPRPHTPDHHDATHCLRGSMARSAVSNRRGEIGCQRTATRRRVTHDDAGELMLLAAEGVHRRYAVVG